MRKHTALTIILLVPIAALLSQTPAQRAMEHTRYLASDLLEGRKSGTVGYRMAAEYVAKQMTEIGLVPAGENGWYFQDVDFKDWKHFAGPLRLRIVEPNAMKFVPARNLDFFPNGGTGSGTIRAPLAFVGYGIVSEEDKWNDYSGLVSQHAS